MVDEKSRGQRRLPAIIACVSIALLLLFGGLYALVMPAFSQGRDAGKPASLPPAALMGHFMAEDIAAQQVSAVTGAKFVGSKACQSCHQDIYTRWSGTRMANVLRDPKTHPDAFAADPASAPPDLRFSKDDVAFIYGSKW